MPAKNLWTREELILALNLYLKLPFGKMHKGNPEVMHLASVIGRTPDAVAIRLTNFAAVDPYHQKRGVKGMTGGIKQVLPIWQEFIENKGDLLFESERILAEKEHQPLEVKYAETLRGTENMKGIDKVREVKTRVNQNVFRQIVLANYNTKCAVTGIDIPDLLYASHIMPWSKNEDERLNPENGICLSALYDKAFDRGYIGFNKDYQVMISPLLKRKIKSNYYDRHFLFLNDTTLTIPKKYQPKKEFLEYHLDTIFKK